MPLASVGPACLPKKISINDCIQEQQQRYSDHETGMFGFVPFAVHRDPYTQRSADKGKQEQRSFRGAVLPALGSFFVIRHDEVSDHVNENKPYNDSGLHMLQAAPLTRDISLYPHYNPGKAKLQSLTSPFYGQPMSREMQS